jgi:hypothetical protein
MKKNIIRTVKYIKVSKEEFERDFNKILEIQAELFLKWYVKKHNLPVNIDELVRKARG